MKLTELVQKRLGGRSPPTYSERLEENKKWSRPCNAKRAVGDLWKVVGRESMLCILETGHVAVEGGT